MEIHLWWKLTLLSFILVEIYVVDQSPFWLKIYLFSWFFNVNAVFMQNEWKRKWWYEIKNFQERSTNCFRYKNNLLIANLILSKQRKTTYPYNSLLILPMIQINKKFENEVSFVFFFFKWIYEIFFKVFFKKGSCLKLNKYIVEMWIIYVTK